MKDISNADTGGNRTRVSRKPWNYRTYESISGYGFTTPAILAILAFTIIPILMAVALVFMKYDILTPPTFVGFENILHIFKDPRLANSYLMTLRFVVLATIINNILGILLAVGINRAMPGVIRYLLRTALFFPVLTTSASLAVVWNYLLAADRGVLNYLLGLIGIDPLPWLTNSTFALYSVVIYDVWRACGYMMVLYLAGLQAIPEAYNEAAKIDGASSIQIFRFITLPLLSPTAFFCVVTSIIGASQVFDNAWVLTRGGPLDATRLIALYIYEVGFKAFDMGYASTISMTLLIILLLVTLFQFWVSKRWVNYE
ncbi:MAG: sugar ABC transporter permease [Anaerolineaceae bacterium]|nr:sugar ABC transporter permease [Anaerolineaceae bacterium]